MDKTLKSSFSLILSKNKDKNMIPQSSAVSLPSVRPLAHSWPQLFMETYLYLFKKQEPVCHNLHANTTLVLKNIWLGFCLQIDGPSMTPCSVPTFNTHVQRQRDGESWKNCIHWVYFTFLLSWMRAFPSLLNRIFPQPLLFSRHLVVRTI